MLLVEGLKAYAQGQAPCEIASGLVQQFKVGSHMRIIPAFVGLGFLECVPETTRTLVVLQAYRDGDALLQCQSARYLERQGQIMQAVALYRSLGAASSLAAQAYRQGVECSRNRDVECQERAWRRAVELDLSPYYYDAIVGLYMAMGRLQDASDLLESAAMTTNDPVFAHVARGRSLDLRKEHSAAVLELQKALELAPDNLDIQYYFGMVLKNAGRFREAKEVLIRVVENRPESFWAMVALGDICLNLAQWDEALMWYDKALGLRTDVVSLYSGRASALIRLGHTREAREALIEALQLDPSNQEVRRLLEQLNNSGK